MFSIEAINPFKAGGLEAVSPMSSAMQANSRLQAMEGTEKSGFQNTLVQLVGSVNETLAAPDALMREAMVTGTADVHDVMAANSKAELVVNLTTQVATKVIQAYDRILQIQI